MAGNPNTTITLKSGKTVSLRPKKISDSLDAAEALGDQASQHPMTYSLQVAQELARRSVVAINGKAVSPKDLLDLDAHFSVEEFGEVLEAVAGKPKSALPERNSKTLLATSSLDRSVHQLKARRHSRHGAMGA